MGGGAFLLTLSLAILGVCFLVIPSHAATNNNVNTVNAETYVQDGVEYETVYLTSDHDANHKIVRGARDRNCRYVLTDDWTISSANTDGMNNDVFTNSVIFDLNGHQITGALTFCTTFIEITDTSPARTGRWTGGFSLFYQNGFPEVKSLTISGGTFQIGTISSYQNNCAFNIRGGNLTNTADEFIHDIRTGYTHEITFASWVTPTYNSSEELTAFTSPTHFAVSDSKDELAVLGGANDLTGGELATLALTNDQSYYLWGHNPNGAYAYLDIIRNNREWIKYETIYLPGDKDPSTTRSLLSNRGNCYIILQNDWEIASGNGSTKEMYPANLIFDLNGHTITGKSGSLLGIYGNGPKEFTDSSATGGGNITLCIVSSGTPTLIFSGNITWNGQCAAWPPQVIVRGGESITFQNYSNGSTSEIADLSVAPYMKYRASNSYRYFTAYHEYAVSESDIVSGLYNYEFIYRQGLNVGQLASLAIPNDKTYYLWARNADGGYEYLNIVYRDGQWQKF